VSKELIINVTHDEIKIALLEDKQLVELNKEKHHSKFSVGDIYLARVKKVLPGLNAAFIDVGHEKDAFLHYNDLGPQFKTFCKYLEYVLYKKGKKPSFQQFRGKPDINKRGKITSVLKEGQPILVQIVKEPISNKGPRLNSEIFIAGRNTVLIPFSDKISVSKRVGTDEEKNRLKQLIKSIKPNNYGIIVRTAAQEKKVAVLDSELKQLVEKWENALINLAGKEPPKLVLGELARTSAIIRDMLTGSFNNIYINDATVYQEIKEYISEIAPDKKKIVKQYTHKSPIFDHFSINKQIKSLFGRIVPFKNGSYLIIEHTEALHSIDVNSGTRNIPEKDQETNAVEVNIAAAQEIARQLRLRDMGGIIVIDFIDMQSIEHKKLLYNKMREFMERDSTKHNIIPLTKIGLMQITRQRVRPEMNIKTVEKCPVCKGAGEIKPSILFTDELENEIKTYLEDNPEKKKITLKVHPFLYAYLTKGWNSIRKKWSRQYHCKIKPEAVSSFHFLEHKIVDDKNADYQEF
jgi:ribonuclease G